MTSLFTKTVQAASLVPCEGTACNSAGQLIQLGVNVIQFMIDIAATLAVLFFLYGGFVILTSGGSSDRMQTGKRAVTAAAVGLVIVLASIIVINTFFAVFVKPKSQGGCDSKFKGVYWTIDCAGTTQSSK